MNTDKFSNEKPVASEEFVFDQEILDAFINEAKEHLENLEQDFLMLENQVTDPDQDIIDKAFRSVHSIKGSAGFMQFTKIAKLTHVMEALLQKMRSREIRPESQYIDALLAGCDLLNKMTDDVKDSEKTDILNIYERLSSLLENSSASSKNRQDTKECQSSVEIQEEPQAPVEVQETSPADEESLAFDREMTDIFVSESKENLENIRQDFLILEKQASDSDQNLIDKVFRTIHSVKGSAGMLGFEKTSKLANSMEALLRKMRSGEIRPEPQYVRSLLTGYDILVKMVDNIDDSQKMDIQEAHERILNLLENPVLPAVPKSDPEEEPAKEDSVQSSTPDPEEEPVKEASAMSARPESDPEEEPVKEDSVQPTKPKSDTEEESVKENVVLPAEPEFDPGKEADAESSSAKITPPVAKGHRDHSDTVRIKVELLNLLMTLAGELVLVRNQHLLIVDEIDPETRGISQRMDMVTTQLQEAIMRTRMQPVGNLFAKLPRIVRDVSKRTGKYIQIHTVGDEVELDKTILESLSDPLTHIIRNACDHGIEMPDERYRMNKPETGAIHVHAFHEAGQINIVIRDDGGGMDTEVIKKEALKRGLKSKDELNRMNERDILSIIMMPGFSTSEKTTEISGRGVGMDVVRSSVEQQGGSVEMISEKGEGTAIHLRLPLTLAIIPCLIVEIGDERYAIPKVSVDELVCLYDEEVFTGIEYAGVQEVCRLRDALLPIVRMKEVLSRPQRLTEKTRSEITEKYSCIARVALEKGEHIRQTLLFAVVKIGMQRFGLVVDRVMGSEEIVVNPIHPKLKSLDIYSGTTIMGDGAVALILDIHGIAAHTGVEFISETEKAIKKGTSSDGAETQRVLIFENGEQERFAVPLPLIRRVQDILVSRIEAVGSKSYITIDGISTLILRLDQLLDVSPCVEKDEMYLLLPRHTSRPFGILMSRLMDVVAVPLTLNEDSYMEDGILGTAIVQERMTLFPDIYHLLEKADPGRNANQKAASSQISETLNYKILLVEDAVFFRRLVKGYLESDGYLVETAENGLEALEMMEEAKFDLIVSDIEMPEMDGWTFLKQVRGIEKYKDMPAVALTTLDSPEDQAKMKRVGFNAYEKKIDRERLLAIVEQLLQGQRSEF